MSAFLFVVKVPTEGEKSTIDADKSKNESLIEKTSSEKDTQTDHSDSNGNVDEEKASEKEEAENNKFIKQDLTVVESNSSAEVTPLQNSDDDGAIESEEWDFGDHSLVDAIGMKSEEIDICSSSEDKQCEKVEDTGNQRNSQEAHSQNKPNTVNCRDSIEKQSSNELSIVADTHQEVVNNAEDDECDDRKNVEEDYTKETSRNNATCNTDVDVPRKDAKLKHVNLNVLQVNEEQTKNDLLKNENKTVSDVKQTVTNKPSTSISKSSSDRSFEVKSVEVNGAIPASVSLPVDSGNCKTVSFLEMDPLIESVKEVLDLFNIDNVTMEKTDNGKCWQIIFVDEGGERCEDILNKLATKKIGDFPNTSISIFPASIYRGSAVQETTEEEETENWDEIEEQIEGKFKKSIRARMIVTQVVNSVKENAEFTFDYVLLIILASVIAGLGLAENSSVILVASMLVSPLMGPILAGTFGTVIKNVSLRTLGFKSELNGLILCIISGFIFGIVTGIVGLNGAIWGSGDSWPSDEMKARGILRGLWVGVLIALPSGAGVALSVLGGNTGSLVGVAISASLLPPAVNAGMLWAYSMLSAIFPPSLQEMEKNVTVGNTSQIIIERTYIEPLGCPAFLNNQYSPVYNCNMSVETAVLGAISLALTLLNITCIIIMGIIVLKIKEVAPQASMNEESEHFWKEDIQIARDSYQTMKGPLSVNMASQARQMLQEWKRDKGSKPEDTLRFRRMVEEVENYPAPRGMPSTVNRVFSRELQEDFQQAELDLMYSNSDLSPDNKERKYDVYRTVPSHRTIHFYHRGQPKIIKRSISEEAPQTEPIKDRLRLTSETSTSSKTSIISFRKFIASRKINKLGKPESALAKRRQTKKEPRFKVLKVEDENELDIELLKKS